MPRPKSAPSYCIHSRSGQAYTTVEGRQIPLGKADSAESRATFDRIVGEWYSNGRKLPQIATGAAARPAAGPTITVLVDAFWTHALTYYTAPVRDNAGQPVLNGDGTPRREPTSELDNYRQVLRLLRRLYGDTPAADFACPQLEAVRELMIHPHANPETGRTEPGWTRASTNRQIGRLKHVFGWAVTKGIVPVSVHETLLRLPGLRAGKTDAREGEPVRPVEEGRALALIPYVSPQVGAMIRVQLLCGMRSTEVCIMRPQDIDQACEPWTYRPMFHKTQHHGITREIPIGPQARAVLAPFLEGREPGAFLFSPAEADAERHRQQRAKRKTPVQPSQVLRARRAGRRPVRASRNRYDRTTYYNAIRVGCEKAFGMPAEYRTNRADYPDEGDIPEAAKEKLRRRKEKLALRARWHAENAWHPHMIRHRTAGVLRKEGGLEAVQSVLGHTNTKMAQHYAGTNPEKGREAIERIG